MNFNLWRITLGCSRFFSSKPIISCYIYAYVYTYLDMPKAATLHSVFVNGIRALEKGCQRWCLKSIWCWWTSSFFVFWSRFSWNKWVITQEPSFRKTGFSGAVFTKMLRKIVSDLCWLSDQKRYTYIHDIHSLPVGKGITVSGSPIIAQRSSTLVKSKSIIRVEKSSRTQWPPQQVQLSSNYELWLYIQLQCCIS